MYGLPKLAVKAMFYPTLGPIAAVTAPAGTPKDVVDTYYFTARGHWELSHTITTNHLVRTLNQPHKAPNSG